MTNFPNNPDYPKISKSHLSEIPLNVEYVLRKIENMTNAFCKAAGFIYNSDVKDPIGLVRTSANDFENLINQGVMNFAWKTGEVEILRFFFKYLQIYFYASPKMSRIEKKVNKIEKKIENPPNSIQKTLKSQFHSQIFPSPRQKINLYYSRIMKAFKSRNNRRALNTYRKRISELFPNAGTPFSQYCSIYDLNGAEILQTHNNYLKLSRERYFKLLKEFVKKQSQGIEAQKAKQKPRYALRFKCHLGTDETQFDIDPLIFRSLYYPIWTDILDNINIDKATVKLKSWLVDSEILTKESAEEIGVHTNFRGELSFFGFSNVSLFEIKNSKIRNIHAIVNEGIPGLKLRALIHEVGHAVQLINCKPKNFRESILWSSAALEFVAHLFERLLERPEFLETIFNVDQKQINLVSKYMEFVNLMKDRFMIVRANTSIRLMQISGKISRTDARKIKNNFQKESKRELGINRTKHDCFSSQEIHELEDARAICAAYSEKETISKTRLKEVSRIPIGLSLGDFLE